MLKMELISGDEVHQRRGDECVGEGDVVGEEFSGRLR